MAEETVIAVELREVVTQTDRAQTCAMLLEEVESASPGAPRRILPVFIGPVEAIALGRAAMGDKTSRPLTHDLLVNVTQALGAILQRAIITRIDRHHDSATFIAELEYLTASGDLVRVDARPSDALVIATQCHAGVHVARSVMDAASVHPHEGDGPFPSMPDHNS